MNQGKHVVMSDGRRILTFLATIQLMLIRWAASFTMLV